MRKRRKPPSNLSQAKQDKAWDCEDGKLLGSGQTVPNGRRELNLTHWSIFPSSLDYLIVDIISRIKCSFDQIIGQIRRVNIAPRQLRVANGHISTSLCVLRNMIRLLVLSVPKFIGLVACSKIICNPVVHMSDFTNISL